jgi:hypothetical protein
MYMQAPAGYEKAFKAEHTSSIRTMNNLAILYKAQYKLAKAEAMHERALSGREKAFGPEHRDTLAILDNLVALCCKRHYLQLPLINKSKVQSSLNIVKEGPSSGFIVFICHSWVKWHRARTRLSNRLGHMLLSVGNLHDAAVAFA